MMDIRSTSGNFFSSFCGVLFCITGLISSAQENLYQQVNIASPDASSLLKFTDIPVNYHTGIPSINIPIYTIQEGPLTLPISLSYHASGHRVMNPSSWVGLGWALSAGGVVSRSVNGSPDEKNTNSGSINNDFGHYSDGGYSSYVKPLGYPEQKDGHRTYQWKDVVSGKRDGGPDMFTFNFGGYSGKFYFRNDGSVAMYPPQDIEVVPLYPDQRESIQGFTFLLPDGTKYIFGDSLINEPPVGQSYPAVPIDRTKTINNYNQGGNLGKVISSWYLRKIISANGQFSIDLSYTKQSYGYHMVNMFPVKPIHQQKGVHNPFFPLGDRGYNIMKLVVEGVRLTKISFSGGEVNFNPGTSRTDLANGALKVDLEELNTEAKTLDNIEIRNSENTLCKKIEFQYDYFNDPSSILPGNLTGYTINSDRKRLKLEQIKETNCDNSVEIPPYIFEYYEDVYLPRRLSFAQDFWGYYNGAENSELISTYTENYFTEYRGADRDPSWPEMRAGAIRKIHYPTGGHSEFQFEPHDTHVDYNTMTKKALKHLSVGFDGGNRFVEHSLEIMGIPEHEISISNSSGSTGVVIVEILNSSGRFLEGYVVDPGQDIRDEIILPQDTYRIKIRNDDFVTGNGGQITISQFQSTQISEDRMVGGLRIKKLIFSEDGITPELETNYSYLGTDNYGQYGVSSGQLYGRPTIVQVIRNDVRKIGIITSPPFGDLLEGCLSPGLGSGHTYYKSPKGVRPLESTQGYHIGYRRVEVEKSENGKTVYYYLGDAGDDDIAIRNVLRNVCDQTVPNFPEAPLPIDPYRGKLSKEVIYDESGSLLKETIFTYDYQKLEDAVHGLNIQAIETQMFPNFYSIDNYRLISSRETSRKYFNGESIKTEKIVDYESEDHNQPTKITLKTNDGLLERNFIYGVDLDLCDGSVPYACWSILEGNRLSAYQTYQTNLSDCEETKNHYYNYTNHYGLCGDDTACREQVCKFLSWHDYNQELQDALVSYRQCRQEYHQNLDNCYDAIQGDDLLKPFVAMYKLSRNPLIESFNYQNSSLVSSSLFLYKVENGELKPSELMKLDPSNGTFLPISRIANSLDIDPSYYTDVEVLYNQDNLIQVRQPDGMVISYLYDQSGTVPIVSALGVDHNTLEVAYTNAGGDRELMRADPNLEDASISTFYYRDNVGLFKIVDQNGKESHFDYDWTGRLTEEKIQDHVIQKYEYKY